MKIITFAWFFLLLAILFSYRAVLRLISLSKLFDPQWFYLLNTLTCAWILLLIVFMVMNYGESIDKIKSKRKDKDD